jgi:hypothetical protein
LDPEICDDGNKQDTTVITEKNEIVDSFVSQEEQTLDGIQEEGYDSDVGVRTRSGRPMSTPS